MRFVYRMFSAFTAITRALPFGLYAVACSVAWLFANRLSWLQGSGVTITAAVFSLLVVVVIVVRGSVSYRRSQKAHSLLQHFTSKVVDLALLAAALDKRSEQDEDAGGTVSQPYTRISEAANVSNSYADTGAAHAESLEQDVRTGPLKAGAAALAELLHLISLFHAVSLGMLRLDEDLTTLSKHQLPPGDPSGAAFAEGGPAGTSASTRTSQSRGSRLRMPGTSVAMPQAPSASGMLKASLMGHWRECQDHSSKGEAAWMLWMCVLLPVRCILEVLTLVNLVPGRSEIHKRELRRMCPLTVLLGATKEEVDTLISAGDGAARTAQVWLQDALLAPPQDDNALEPSSEEQTRMQVLLSDSALASAQAQSLADAPNVLLWRTSATNLVALFTSIFPMVVTSNVSSGVIAAVVSFFVVTTFAAINEATRRHDEPFGSFQKAPEVNIAQQQHKLNEQLLCVVRAEFPGHCMHASDAWGSALDVLPLPSNPRTSLKPSARSEAMFLGHDGSATHAAGRPVVLSMGTLSPAGNASMATGTNSFSDAATTPNAVSIIKGGASTSQLLEPLAQEPSRTASQMSGTSAASVHSEGQQLSTRIAGLPAQNLPVTIAGTSRTSSYDTALGALESLPSHFSPDADSDDDSSGLARAAVAALLADDADPFERSFSDESPHTTAPNITHHPDSHGSRSASRAFSTNGSPQVNDLRFIGSRSSAGSMNNGVNYCVNIPNKAAFGSVSQVLDTRTASDDFAAQHCAVRTTHSSDDAMYVQHACGNKPLSLSSNFGGFSSEPAGYFHNPNACGICNQCASADGSTCMGCTHGMHTQRVHLGCGLDGSCFDVASGVFVQQHDMNVRHMRCSGGAGSAMRANSRGSSCDRRQSMKGDVVVDLGGMGVPSPPPDTFSPTTLQSLLTLQPHGTTVRGTGYRTQKAAAARLQTSALCAEYSSLEPCSSPQEDSVELSLSGRAVSSPSCPGTLPWTPIDDESDEPETPRNFASMSSLPAAPPWTEMHGDQRAVRRLRPLSVDAIRSTTEEFGTPVSGLINPLCSSPRLVASEDTCNHFEHARSHSADSASAQHPRSSITPSNIPLPPFSALPPTSLPKHTAHSAQSSPAWTKSDKSVTSTGAWITLQQRSGVSSLGPMHGDEEQLPLSSHSSLLYASHSSTASVENLHMQTSLSSDPSLTRQACDAMDRAEEVMIAFTSGRSHSPRHVRSRSMHACHACPLNLEHLTPRPRSCSIYSTDPETDLARLLSPSSTSEDGMSGAPDSPLSTTVLSTNNSPRRSVEGFRAAPELTTLEEAPVATHATVALQELCPQVQKKLSCTPVATSVRAVRTHQVLGMNGSLNACEPFTVCSDAAMATSVASVRHISDSAWLRQPTRACNFDDGILDGYGGVHSGLVPMFNRHGCGSSGTVSSDSAESDACADTHEHHTCEDVRKNLPELSAPDHTSGGDAANVFVPPHDVSDSCTSAAGAAQRLHAPSGTSEGEESVQGESDTVELYDMLRDRKRDANGFFDCPEAATSGGSHIVRETDMSGSSEVADDRMHGKQADQMLCSCPNSSNSANTFLLMRSASGKEKSVASGGEDEDEPCQQRTSCPGLTQLAAKLQMQQRVDNVATRGISLPCSERSNSPCSAPILWNKEALQKHARQSSAAAAQIQEQLDKFTRSQSYSFALPDSPMNLRRDNSCRQSSDNTADENDAFHEWSKTCMDDDPCSLTGINPNFRKGCSILSAPPAPTANCSLAGRSNHTRAATVAAVPAPALFPPRSRDTEAKHAAWNSMEAACIGSESESDQCESEEGPRAVAGEAYVKVVADDDVSFESVIESWQARARQCDTVCRQVESE